MYFCNTKNIPHFKKMYKSNVVFNSVLSHRDFELNQMFFLFLRPQRYIDLAKKIYSTSQKFGHGMPFSHVLFHPFVIKQFTSSQHLDSQLL